MPLQIVRQDIARMDTDAIVSAANTQLVNAGGVDGAIRAAAGPDLHVTGTCAVGEAVATSAGRLKAKYIIHTVVPVWRGGTNHEQEQLASCYLNALDAAQRLGCESIAFPLLSSGAFGYPNSQALSVAMNTIADYLSKRDMDVYLVVFDRESYEISAQLRKDIQSYIDETYEGLEQLRRHPSSVLSLRGRRRTQMRDGVSDRSFLAPQAALAPQKRASARPLVQALDQLDETFSQMLLRMIDEKGISDVQCYRRANLDRRLFSKIRSNPGYQPSKRTVLALAIALELSLEDTEMLLRSAGFAISHANKFDIIIEYFIQNQNYDIFQINEALFEFDQALLGS